MLVSVYGVPDPEAGDQVMAALALQPRRAFDPAAFAALRRRRARPAAALAPDLRARRRASSPTTHTNKILKRTLRREKFLVDRIADPIYWRPRGAADFRRFTIDDLAALRERFARAGYADRLEDWKSPRMNTETTNAQCQAGSASCSSVLICVHPC